MRDSFIGPLFFISFILILGCAKESSYVPERTVYIQKKNSTYTLIRNGAPFFIQGVAGHKNLDLLKKIGGNTIRTYDTVGIGEILDEAEKYNLAVIAGLVLPKSKEDWFYKNDSLIAEYDKNLRWVAEKYGNHPALLMWCLGNEPIFYDFTNFRFSSAYNRFLKTLRDADPNHPVTLAMANFSDRAFLNIRLKIPDLDLLMVNTFGRLPKLQSDMSRYKMLWDGPYIVGEYGVSGPWETDNTAWNAPLEPTDKEKAERLKQMYHELPHGDPRFLGATAFYWGQRQEVTHTWFNFFSEAEKSESVFALSELWDHPLDGNRPPEVRGLTIDNSARYNSFLFKKSTIHYAEVNLTDPENDSLSIEWSLRPEDWLFEKKETPIPVNESFISYENNGSYVKFKTPTKPGPFRLFVKITDGKGNFSVTNMPFYVVQ